MTKEELIRIDNTPMFATAFRGSDLTEEEESALDHLFDMMTAIKQQVLLRKALHFEKGIPYIDWEDFFAERGKQDEID